jgi:autonomous glycyl radical cofactor GrcA
VSKIAVGAIARSRPKPVRPAIDHRIRIAMVNEQRAVVAMSARTDLELAASAEEGQLNCRNVPFHVDPQAAFWSREGGQLTAASCLRHHPAVVRPRAA